MGKLSFNYVARRISRVYESCRKIKSIWIAEKYCDLLLRAFSGSEADKEMLLQLSQGKKLSASYRLISWLV